MSSKKKGMSSSEPPAGPCCCFCNFPHQVRGRATRPSAWASYLYPFTIILCVHIFYVVLPLCVDLVLEVPPEDRDVVVARISAVSLGVGLPAALISGCVARFCGLKWPTAIMIFFGAPFIALQAVASDEVLLTLFRCVFSVLYSLSFPLNLMGLPQMFPPKALPTVAGLIQALLGLAAIFVLLGLSALPQVMEDAGSTPLEGLTTLVAIGTSIGLLTGLYGMCCVQRDSREYAGICSCYCGYVFEDHSVGVGLVRRPSDKDDPNTCLGNPVGCLRHRLVEPILAIVSSLDILLAFCCGIVAAASVTCLFTFLTLTAFNISAPIDGKTGALAVSGRVVAMSQITGMISAPIFGSMLGCSVRARMANNCCSTLASAVAALTVVITYSLLAILSAVSTEDNNVLPLYFASAFAGIGSVLINVVGSSLQAVYTPDNAASAIAPLYQAANEVGSLVCAVIGGVIYPTSGMEGVAWMVVVMASLLLVLSLLAVVGKVARSFCRA